MQQVLQTLLISKTQVTTATLFVYYLIFIIINYQSIDLKNFKW